MQDENIHLFADFTLDLARGCLLNDGEPVHLRPQAYEVLKYLTENRGRLIGKDQLVEAVWQGRSVTDDALVQCLIEVRRALGAESKTYLRNVRGRGYIFDPEADAGPKRKGPESGQVWTREVDLLRVVVEEEVEEGHDGATAEAPALPAGLMAHISRSAATTEADAAQPAASAAHAVSAGRSYRRAAAILTALALAAAGLAYFTLIAPRDRAIRSVAVLPFANEIDDPNLEYLTDGLSEDLIDRLSQLPGLKVIARSSSFKYKGKGDALQEVATALGVEALVTGRVVKRGDDLEVRAELVDVREGIQIWGERYGRKAADIQSVQEEMARTISEKLRLRLSGAQQQRLTKHATGNSQAYEAYLNGLFYLRMQSRDKVRRALDYFNRAVALDPNFAPGWVGVANTHRYFAADNLVDPNEALVRARTAIQRALDLDETLAEAHTVLSGLKMDEWDWAGAELGYRRAIELNPNLVDAHLWYSRYLSTIGRHAEALAEIDRAQEIDPLQANLQYREALALYFARRYDEAIEKQLEAMKMDGQVKGNTSLGFMYEANGMYEQAIEEYEKVRSRSGETTWRQIILGYALAMSGKRREAQSILDRLKVTKDYVSPAELAILYAGLGDKEGAIAALERAYTVHDLQMQHLIIAPQYDSLRADPRFQDLIRRVGFPR